MLSASEMTRAELLETAWSTGNLQYLLRPYQRDMQQRARAAKRAFFGLCGRRTGKTHTLSIVDSIEDSLKNEGFVTKLAFETGIQAELVIGENIDPVLRDCPDHLRPKYRAKHMIYEFPTTGSTIWLAGADNRRNADRLRGTGANKVKLDECGFFYEFDYLLKSVLVPQLFTTDGTIWYLSSPSTLPSHPAMGKYAECEGRGDSVSFDVWITEPWYGRERILEFAEEVGGEESEVWIREFLAKPIPDSTIIVVPEFRKNKATLVCPWNRPKWFKRYTIADFGFDDLTSVVFAYYDYEAGRIVIEDELYRQHEGSISITNEVRKKEIDLWGASAPIDRFADAPLQMIADIHDATGIMWAPVRKDDFDSSLNVLRMDCYRGVFAINPKCTETIAHLMNATWANASKKDYARQAPYGHFDGLDSTRYLSRHVDRQTNPAAGKESINLQNNHVMWQTAERKKTTFGRTAFGRQRRMA